MTRLATLALLVAVSTLSLPGCFHQRSEVKQVESLSYLKFVGNVRGAVATVTRDGKPVITSIELAASTSYTVRPGTYQVSVVKGDIEVVRRNIYVADGTTAEVRVP
jgi:hypothetical protein